MLKALPVRFFLALTLITSCAQAQQLEARITPVTDAMLANPPQQDWLMWRRTLDSWGYSPLKQINADNVRQLQLVWARGLEPGPQEGTPLVHDGVLYFPNPRDIIQAVDATTGDLIWEHRRPLPADIEKYINAPYINRNIAIHGNLIIDTSADGYLYALDARTGKEVWNTLVSDYKTAIHQTSGPITAAGKVFSGRGCDPLPNSNPEPCVIVAHDAQTGRELWRTRTIPAQGERGNETWGDVPFAERKHVGTWMPPSYDPELGLVFIGTSVTSPAPKFLLSGNDKKYLYHNCTLALDAKTGKIVWYYQHVVDHWDLDHTFERILLETEVAPAKDAVKWINPAIKPGEKRKVITGIPGKTGIVYTLDRRTGQFLWATPTIYQNVVANIDGRTGEVTVEPGAIFKAKGDEATVCPSIHGGKNWPAGAYSPLTGEMYFPLQNTCSHYTVTIASRKEPSSYGLRSVNTVAPGTQNVGSIHAISASTGRTAWKFEQRAALLSLVTTGGGLLFGGDVAGRFRAFDQKTGQVLWQTNLGSQVTGFPITYSVGDRQYIAVSVGQAVNTAGYLAITPEIRPSNNNNLYVFALPVGWQTANTGPRQAAPIASPAVASTTVSAASPVAQCHRTDRNSTTISGTADRTFSASQAAQGKKLYLEQQCSLCHGANMLGSAGAPALADSGFRAAWQEHSLGELFDCIRNTMPPGRTGTLENADYARLLAAILEANGFAAGGADAVLPPDTGKLNGIGIGKAAP
ncbi:MAG: PQQ-binding-like beta-propeller repeat protein [Gammaproteobacteria bacterium]